MSINNVVLVGRMTRDAELRYTPSNVAVATLTLAVNRPFKNQNGEHEADFINTDINDKQSQICLEWGDSLILRLEKNGQELYSYKSEKDKANELLTKISRKEKGYDSYLNLLEEKENG